jgi:Fe-S-cluster containining protein
MSAGNPCATSPEQFVVPYAAKSLGTESFRLQSGGPGFGLALDKRGRFKPGQPCVFLLELAGGEARCGVYADRPLVCQTYPMSLWSGLVSERKDALCPPDSWSSAAVTRLSWRRGLQRLRMQWDLYAEVVARWNARVDVHPGERFSILEYYSYLLNVYDRISILDRELGDAVLSQAEADWPCLPRAPLDPAALAAGGERPWLVYLARARRIVGAFYPELPPLPPRLMATTAADELAAVAAG